MKVIDFDKKGNVIRFYLGDDNLKQWHGDDWNDVPYDCNASEVYDEFISGYADVYVPFDLTVMEPCDDWHYTNCPWCKDDMVARSVPCIIIAEDDRWSAGNEFSKYAASDNVAKIYFGDTLDPGIYKAEICEGGKVKFVAMK